MKRVAVVTDVVDPGSFFPIWHSYYGKEFGYENLHVVAYPHDNYELLKSIPLGGITWLQHAYNNELRSSYVSALVTSLLKVYDIVIRVDVDEFIVPDRRLASTLKDYMEHLKAPYITAFGLDIIAGRDDAPLDFSSPIIPNQRTLAYPNCSLNKTCVVTIPTLWVGGFHYCNHYPYFHGLFMLHMRLADLNHQINWNKTMRQSSPADSHVQTRYTADLEKLEKYRSDVLARPRKAGWDGVLREQYMQRFFASISPQRRPDGCVYVGEHFHDNVLVELPEEISGYF